MRVWRSHLGEGFTYRPTAFKVDLIPKAKSELCQLLVTGEIDLLDDDDMKTTKRGNAKIVYGYDMRTNAFTRIYARAPIPLSEIDLSMRK